MSYETNEERAEALRKIGRRVMFAEIQAQRAAGVRGAHGSASQGMRAAGEKLWPLSYAKTSNELYAWQLLANSLVGNGMPEPLLHTEMFSGMMFAARWYDCAWPTIELGREHAAALMATSLPDADIDPPWPAFMLRVPAGLLYMSDKDRTVDISEIFVARYVLDAPTTPEPLWFIAMNSHGSDLTLYKDRQRFSILVSDGDSACSEIFEEREIRSTTDKRCMDLGVRLVLNLCQSLSDPSVAGDMCHYSSGLHRPCGGDGEVPRSQTFKWLPPVKVKCADAIRDWCRTGIGTPRTVRWLTRGHWRNQACGPGLSERRPTWIEPYWNNVSSEIVATRTHVVVT